MAINFGVSYLAVVVATIAAFAIGFVWYSLLFGKQWSAARKMTPEQMRPDALGFVVSVLAAFVNAWVVAIFALNLGGKTLADGVLLGLFVWLGFFATMLAANTVFQKLPWSLWLIDAGHAAIVQVVIAAIVTVWR